jgi:hypothetical protein
MLHCGLRIVTADLEAVFGTQASQLRTGTGQTACVIRIHAPAIRALFTAR